MISVQQALRIESRYNNGEKLVDVLEDLQVPHHFYNDAITRYYESKEDSAMCKNLKLIKAAETRLFELAELINDPQTHRDSRKKLALKFDSLKQYYAKANVNEKCFIPNELLR